MRSTGPDSEDETSATAASAARAAGRQRPGNKADGEDAVGPRTRFVNVVRCLLLFLAEALLRRKLCPWVSLGIVWKMPKSNHVGPGAAQTRMMLQRALTKKSGEFGPRKAQLLPLLPGLALAPCMPDVAVSALEY